MGRIVVLASQGQLGSLILKRLREAAEDAIGLERDICDLECPLSIQRLFHRFGPIDTLYNAGAFTAVDLAESRRRQAFRVNAIGPGFLAALCREKNVRLVHFSTDYVFGDGHRQPIAEESVPKPLSVYGRSKRLGEELISAHYEDALILRSCGLYSAHRPNFLRTVIGAACKGRELAIVDDQVVTPTSAESLAAQAIALSKTELTGIVHASAGGACTWYEFARAAFETLGMKVAMRPVPTSYWNAPAQRPAYSVLANHLLEQAHLDTFGEWREELQLFLERWGDQLLASIEKEESPRFRMAG